MMRKQSLLFVVALAALAVAGSAYDAIEKSGVSCQDGQHATPLVTYIVQSSSATLTPLAGGYEGLDGEFATITVPKDTVPSTMPYLANVPTTGRLYQDVLNTSQFLDDWVYLSVQSNPSKSEFAMPAQAAATQCFGKYQDLSTETQFDAVPANAMVRFDSDPSRALLVDIFDVSFAEDRSYVFTVRQAPDLAKLEVPEGQCHSPQNLAAPHYHHTSVCMDIILGENIKESQVTGEGMTMFIKLGTHFSMCPPFGLLPVPSCPPT